MDFISLYKSGVKNVVATLGTSLTKQHCILLKRFCEEVVIVYDGDTSGISSAVRAGEIFIEEGISAKIVLLPEKSDPDKFINENGKEKFDLLVQDARNIAEYIIESANNRYRAGKITSKECTSIIIDLLSKTTNPVERGLYLTKASNLLGIRESDLLSLIKIKKRKKSDGNTDNSQDNNRSIDRLITKILLKYPDLVHEIDTQKVLQNIEDDRLKVIFTQFIENNTNDISSLINSFEESIYQDLISQLVFSSDDLIDKDTSKKILNNCITKLELESINLKLKEIRFKIEELKNSHDKETEKKLLAKYRDLVELEKNLRGNINDI